jgi:hypothetical protein
MANTFYRLGTMIRGWVGGQWLGLQNFILEIVRHLGTMLEYFFLPFSIMLKFLRVGSKFSASNHDALM